MSNQKKYFQGILAAISMVMPALVLAATGETVSSEVDIIKGYFNQFLTLLIGLAILVFVFYVIKYFIIQSDGPTSRQEGRNYILWSVIALFVILSVWGIVNIFLNTFDLGNEGNTPTDIGNIFPQ